MDSGVSSTVVIQIKTEAISKDSVCKNTKKDTDDNYSIVAEENKPSCVAINNNQSNQDKSDSNFEIPNCHLSRKDESKDLDENSTNITFSCSDRIDHDEKHGSKSNFQSVAFKNVIFKGDSHVCDVVSLHDDSVLLSVADNICENDSKVQNNSFPNSVAQPVIDLKDHLGSRSYSESKTSESTLSDTAENSNVLQLYQEETLSDNKPSNVVKNLNIIAKDTLISQKSLGEETNNVEHYIIQKDSEGSKSDRSECVKSAKVEECSENVTACETDKETIIPNNSVNSIKGLETPKDFPNQLNLFTNKKLLYDISAKDNLENEHFQCKGFCSEILTSNNLLESNASCSSTSIDTTSLVLKPQPLFQYDHEIYFSRYTLPTTNCHLSLSCTNQLSPLVFDSKISSQNKLYIGSSECFSQFISIKNCNTKFKCASADENHLEDNHHLPTFSQISKNECVDELISPQKEQLPLEVSCSKYALGKYGSPSNLICKDTEMGSKNSISDTSQEYSNTGTESVFGNKEETFLSEFPPDRSDGSDSGLGCEFVDERVPLRTDSLLSDDNASNNWSTKSDIQALPSTSKHPRVIKSNLKRSRPQDENEPKTKKVKKSIEFENVSIFYFPRTQGFTCVPSQVNKDVFY